MTRNVEAGAPEGRAVLDTDRGRVIGFVVLVTVVATVALWLYFQGRAALSAPTRTSPATVQIVIDKRFAAELWHLPSDDLVGFVAVPGGAFKIGSDPAVDHAAYENERWSMTERQGQLDLPAFYIARYEVTVAQFGAFVAATQRAIDSQTLRAPANHPVTNVTWTDAIAYAQWLEAQLKHSSQTPAAVASLLNDGWRLTLPSEAEWEKAARGVDGRLYPWGNVADEAKANFGRSGTAPVGSFVCSDCSFGLADMSGNVWELTRSPYQPYPWKPGDEPRDVSADALFVMRGGAYNDAANNVRAAIRGGIDPGARRPFIGFRLVLQSTR